jgi:glucose-6-phosphate-specific signal transduction histidine kinase
MKIINLLIIILFNFIGAYLSYQWCYRMIIAKHRTPELYYLICYGLCYFCFILISIFLLNKIKQPMDLVICGVLIGIIITLMSPIVFMLVMEDINKSVFNLDFIMGFLGITSLVTLNFIIYPAILLCCHYSIGGIQKISSKLALKQ